MHTHLCSAHFRYLHSPEFPRPDNGPTHNGWIFLPQLKLNQNNPALGTDEIAQ